MNSTVLKGKTALITGASSGLGADFARELARLGCTVLLVARREDALRALGAEISAQFGVQAAVYPCDLAAPGAPSALFEQLLADGHSVDVLVNNAGFGCHGDFSNTPWEREKAMLELDILALAEMTKRFLPAMLARNFGFILQVASVAAFQPTPSYASYAAAKSYVLQLSEALNYELRRTGVGVTAVCPGISATEFLQVAGQQPSLYQRIMMMKSPDVVRAGIGAMLARKPSMIPGFGNRLVAFSVRFLPRRLVTAMADLAMRV